MRSRSPLSTLGLLAALTAPLLACAASSPLTDVIALPEFKVFEDRPLPAREKWDYVRVRNFAILSNTSARVTKEFARDLSEFQSVLALVAPQMLIRAEQPVMIVLCGTDNAFERFTVKSGVLSTRGRGTSLVRDAEIASIVVDYENRSAAVPTPFLPNFRGAGGGDWSASAEIHSSTEFIRQYIHLSLSQLHPRPPAWVAEGIANIYSSLDYNNKWIEIGLPKSFAEEVTISPMLGSSGFPLFSSSTGTANSFSLYDNNGSRSYDSSRNNLSSDVMNLGAGYSYQLPLVIMPMEKLFAITYDSPELRGSGGGPDFELRFWKKQATAFVHLCLYSQDGQYRRGFLKFSARASTEPVTEALFKECFGISYKDMASRLRAYTEFTNYRGKIIEANKGYSILGPRPAVDVRAATDAEIGRIKGETLRLAGQDEAARREFVVAYLRGERDPELLASLGLMARQRHDDARARTYLEAVALAKNAVPRPRAYLELARLRAAALDTPRGPHPLALEEVTTLLTPLFVAQRLPQQLVAIYLEIAATWERSAFAPLRENLAALEYGVRLFPDHGELLLRTVSLLIKHGYKSDAAPLIQQALKTTRDPEMKSRLEALRQKIDGVSATTPAHFAPEENLGPALRQRLTDYRAAKATAHRELRAQLDATEKLPPASRSEKLAAFAATQTAALRQASSARP